MFLFSSVLRRAVSLVVACSVTTLALCDDPLVYVMNDDAALDLSTFSVINAVSDTVTESGQPSSTTRIEGMVISPDGTRGYISSYDTGDFVAIDLSTNTIIPGESLPGGCPGAEGIALTKDGKTAFVADYDHPQVYKIDLTTPTNPTVATISLPDIDATEAYFCAVTPDGNTVFVPTADNDTVYWFDVSDPSTVHTIGVGSGPEGIAITPDGTYAYVANSRSNTVSVINVENKTVEAIIDVGLCPWRVAISPDGKKVYVACQHSGNISVITVGETTSVLLLDTLIYYPSWIAITPDGTKAFVSDWSSHVYPITLGDTPTVTTITNTDFHSPYALAITPDQAPMALFTVAYRGMTVDFDASGSTTPEGTIESYAWDFGDGNIDVGASPTTSHAYGSSGTFSVTLVVTNSQGTSTEQTFTGQMVSNNGGPSALAQQDVVIPTAPPQFVGKAKIHAKAKKLFLKTTWQQSPSQDIVRYEIFARRKRIETIVVPGHLKDVIRLHPHHIPHKHLSKKYRLYLSNKYKIRAVNAQGVPSPFTPISVSH